MTLALSPDTTTLLVMDVQDRLVAAMPDDARGEAVDNIIRLVQGARILGLRVLVTEQYPTGLGRTIEPVAQAIAEFPQQPPVVEKVEFDACCDGGFLEALDLGDGADSPRRTVLLCGMETHICVYQTARALVERGHGVHVPVDATCCRRPANHRVAERLLERAGAVLTTTETALFDLLKRAGSEEFKAISKLVR
jgi:nicotinamidase-related amidase